MISLGRPISKRKTKSLHDQGSFLQNRPHRRVASQQPYSSKPKAKTVDAMEIEKEACCRSYNWNILEEIRLTWRRSYWPTVLYFGNAPDQKKCLALTGLKIDLLVTRDSGIFKKKNGQWTVKSEKHPRKADQNYDKSTSSQLSNLVATMKFHHSSFNQARTKPDFAKTSSFLQSPLVQVISLKPRCDSACGWSRLCCKDGSVGLEIPAGFEMDRLQKGRL